MLRSHLETGLAALSAGLALLTLVMPSWIEELTGIDPDGGNGMVEWLIVLLFGAAAVTLGLLARRDYLLARSHLLSMRPSPERTPEAGGR